MSYKTPIAKTTDLGLVQVGAGLSITPTGILSTTGSTIADFGYFYDTSTQTNPIANTAMPILLNSTGDVSGTSVVAGSRVTVTKAGAYLVEFTVQLDKSDGGVDSISIWLRKNGVDVPASNQEYQIDPQGTVRFVSGTYIISLLAGEYIQLVWSSADIDAVLRALPAQVLPTRPSTASSKVSIVQI